MATASVVVTKGSVMLQISPTSTLSVAAARDLNDLLRQSAARAEMASPGECWRAEIDLAAEPNGETPG